MNISGKWTPAIVLISSIIIVVTLSVDLSVSHVDDNNGRKLYIVYMGSLPAEANYAPSEHHLTILQKVVSGHPNKSLYRSYGRSFNGFAAWLTDQEKDKIKDMEGVLSVIPSEMLQLHTTRSWDFMGFPEEAAGDPALESDIIVGVIDSGIWPELKSFNDRGLGPVPKKWKGSCQGGPDFKCNRKIIGARFYTFETSARDEIGHGTHVASIAAGSKVRNASFNKTLAKGTARGGAPSSRIAAYKVCPLSGCQEASILAAFDDAIADGVDVILLPIGRNNPFRAYMPFSESAIAIGSFHAMAKGIVTVNSASNNGPLLLGIHELAPWLVSVGATTIDRNFTGKVVLGNGKTLTGRSINLHSLGSEPKYPLTYANYFNSTICEEDAIRKCYASCIDKDVVAGKIVICGFKREGISLEHFRDLGAVGVIYLTLVDILPIQPLPAVFMGHEEFQQLLDYAESSEPRATIQATVEANDTLAPRVASFSSRGPDYRFCDILKPDVVAPGVGILAAYPPDFIPFENKESLQYNLMYGTSMSRAHVAGAIAYVKSLHPNWSPSALKSAIMTTAWPPKPSRRPEQQEFAYGSGHINPAKAADPGLIYDISKQDYIGVVCGNYDDKTCLAVSGEDCRCSENKIAPKDLNYPSMTTRVRASGPFNVSFTRVVTNVGHPNSTYKASITAAPGVRITVVPDTGIIRQCWFSLDWNN